jgi:hypothetical protein
MNEQEYNGWFNYETWSANLWITNDQGLYEIATDYAKQEIEGHDQGEVINPYHLGETLRDWIENDLLTLENISGNQDLFNMLTDIGSLGRVNWREIADNFINELRVDC